MVIELRVVQFWSEIILVISNRTSAHFEITHMISDQIALHSVQLQIWGVRSMERGGGVVGSEW